MNLHNTLSHKVEAFEPGAGAVSLYTCGPTVYDYAHIGNLRAFVFYDTLRRTLEAGGYEVRHVMNITDVGHLVADEDESVLSEDKFEKGARREGKTVWDVAAQYTTAFKDDMTAMNILPPNVNPGREKNQTGHDAYARATDFIPEQIEMVQALLDRGFAYQTAQAIYFDIAKLEDYGRLTGQKLKDKEVGARDEVVTDSEKHHPHDFAVWFFTVGHFSDHTMRWPSPWGEGFPGWHLECSAIIHATLGDPIDIHTGGVDHIGTHHTNEMAQTEGAFGHQLARFWVHNEHLLVDGTKMSKSKGNFYTLRDLTDRGFHPLAFRLLMLQAHYRSQLNFTLDSLTAAQNTLINLYAWADLAHQPGTGTALPDHWIEPIKAALLSDLGSAAALSVVFGLSDTTAPRTEDLKQLDALLGLSLGGRPDITAAERQLITDRQHARQTKDWPAADRLRDELRDNQLEVDDTPAGPRWRRTSLDL